MCVCTRGVQLSMKTSISIVIPLYNKVRHIARAINSVLAQNYAVFELIVVDDGSTDDSGDVVRQIIDPRLRLIVQANGGECAARNRGIQEAQHELIAFLDADDEWLPTFLETVVGLRDRYPQAGMYAAAYRYCEGQRTWRPHFRHVTINPLGELLEDYFRTAIKCSPVTSSSVMIPKHVFNEIGLFPVGIRRGGDLHMWSRIALRYRVAWSPSDGAVYHLSSENRACSVVSLNPDVGAAAAIEEFFASGQAPISPRRDVEEYLVSLRLTHAMACYLRGRRTWTRELLAKTSGTRMFKRQRRRLLWLARLPPALARLALKLRASYGRRR